LKVEIACTSIIRHGGGGVKKTDFRTEKNPIHKSKVFIYIRTTVCCRQGVSSRHDTGQDTLQTK